MKNDARKMALENQIELAQQNAIDFTHACMTIALHDVFGVGKDRLDKVTQRKDEINGELMRRMALPAKNQKAQLNEWVEQDGVDVAMEMLCRCARDAYKTDVQVEDVPDEAVLERQRRETAAMVRQLEVQAVRQEVSRMRVPCVLPLSEAAMREKVEAVNACFDAATTGAATGSNLSPLRSGYASALQSSPDMGAKDQGGR